MSEASHIFKNTFRELFGKKAKDYSEIDKRIKCLIYSKSLGRQSRVFWSLWRKELTELS